MSKSFREVFVCWLYEFYSAGKYIHLIAFQMVRIWINEQVVLWIDESMKISFLWVCVLCSSFSCTFAVPFSAQSLWPHLAISHLTHLLWLQLLSLSQLAGACWLAGIRQFAMERITCWLHNFVAQSASALFLSQSQESCTDLRYQKACPCAKSGWKRSIKWPVKKCIWMTISEMVWSCTLQPLKTWLNISRKMHVRANPACRLCQASRFWSTSLCIAVIPTNSYWGQTGRFPY